MSATVRADLAALLARYDDDTWSAVANRGLLRRARKDLGTVAVAVQHETDVAVELTVGAHTVTMTADGPATARCTCPSAVVCQHVVAAGLWLAEHPSGTGASPVGADDGPRDGMVDVLHDELMALDETALRAAAGLAACRSAHQILDDLDDAPTVTRGRALEVRFPHPALVARYPGGGVAGVVLDAPVRAPERYRVAAVLAWQRAHGLVLPPPAAPSARTRPSAAEESLAAARDRVRASVVAVLRDTVRIGVSHLSPAVVDRLTTAAVGAQGVEYHRLARALRGVADQADLVLARSARADDLALLDEVAAAHALVVALDTAAADGRAPAALVGRARTAYEGTRPLDLVGLGGVPWRSGTGYHGVTAVFWSPTLGRMLTRTDARPVDLAGFDPRARWVQPAPWSGLSSPADTAGRAITLTGARLSADGRLSGAGPVSARATPLDGSALVDRLPVRTTWETLGGDPVRGLTGAGDAAEAWVVLRPASSSDARWDPAEQVVRWQLADGEGAVLDVELPWSRLHAHAVDRIERLGDSLPADALVVVRVRRTRGRLVGEPLSVIDPARPADPVDVLHFDDVPRRTRARTGLVAKLLAAGTPDARSAAGTATDGAGPSADGVAGVPAPVAVLRSLVERRAQRGTTALPGDVLRVEVAAAHVRLRDVGFGVFTPPASDVDPAELLLRDLFVIQQVEQAYA
ncbi:hypothetical protein [Luteimicrobium subarcticum]|uniref:SWIM-type domain-containing protein n=1 Tax=Luteimicrobium subarcticum TaxID=620910 RepID=A0A2M8WRG4_9MICO|nr:hypothetical protein [Luteimicrobium subarcticum]PJI93508.1 hypothetical protein CLV34_2082 [Luteimicrobium subarcticum]